ncbi:putative protein NRT1/ PTR FAMILY 2.3 [Iris pallida]|uniref:Uncharacterized protein n=1 Tax=Iris pallida TaxID=29817 RepID=A0AAX6HBA8_IRIPA|nr:putative protein NRT1/ PTR FAMILY 2.3 [Iris pallida]
MDAKASENPPAVDIGESQSARKQGGWITFPFLAGTMLGLGLSLSGATNNLIVYLIKEYNVKNVDAAQIYNIVNGCTTLAPVAGAVISDAFFGCFPVVAFSTFVNFLALIVFTLTATIRSLRPAAPCTPDACEPPSALHLAILYSGVALLSVGTGGTRFNTMAMGADQFDEMKDQEAFFNWYLVALYVSSVLGYTVIVYVQDSVSWGLGFGLCAAGGAASVALLMAGRRFYRRREAKGSPFTGLARVVVASVRKRKAETREGGAVEYYHGISSQGGPPRDLTPGFRYEISFSL